MFRSAFFDQLLQLCDLLAAILDAAQLALRLGQELQNLANRAAILPLQFLNRVDAAFEPYELRWINLQLLRVIRHAALQLRQLDLRRFEALEHLRCARIDLGGLGSVADPEVPALSVRDLGIIREVVSHDDGLEVVVTPTYSGCPATEVIAQSVVTALEAAGLGPVVTTMQRAPAWSSDWISEDGRRKLREYGIAPERMDIELTESMLMEDSEATRDLLADFARIGVRIAPVNKDVAESLGLPLLGGGLAGLRTRLSSTFAPTERTRVQRLRERILVGRPASEAVRNTWREPDARQAHLLQEAFISSRVVQFQYRARDQRLSRRRVEPHYLLLNHPAWYLLGLDRDTAAGRTFRLDGIGRLQVLDEGFVQLPHRQLAPEVEGVFRPV